MSKKIRLNQREVAKFLKGREMDKMLSEVGRELANAADREAPVGDSGALSSSHYHEVEEISDRKVVRVKSDLDYAATVASRTGYMTRALDGTDI